MSHVLRHGFVILRQASRHFVGDDGTTRAAAIAFFTLLSVAPALYLVAQLIQWLQPDIDGVHAAVSRAASFLPPDARPTLERLGSSLPKGRGLLLVALPGLLWAATAGSAALENGINVAFGRPAAGRFWTSRLKAFGLVSAGALVILLSLALSDLLPWLERSRERMGLPPMLGRGAAWVARWTFLALTYGALTGFYKLLPRGRIPLSAAATAALPTVVLWEAARRLFGAVLVRLSSHELLTGTLAGSVAFLLWLYTAAAVTLVGAEIAAVLAGRRPAEAPRAGLRAP